MKINGIGIDNKVSLPDFPDRFESADRLMRSAMDQGVFPGAVLWVAHQGQAVFYRSYGWADLFSRRHMTCETIFDLASLTKPLATTLAMMKLVQGRLVALETPLGRLWPDLPLDKRPITIRQLLCHRSGLPPWRPYFMRLRQVGPWERMSTLRRLLVDEALDVPPGTRTAYSDLGFLWLQWVVETVTGQRLDHYVAESIYRPLSIGQLFFHDLVQQRSCRGIAATELCPWRKKLLCGEVHDDNAWTLGGVAGHAGLFGTADAVGRLLLALWAAQTHGLAVDWLCRETVETFFQRQAGGTYALGFDTPSAVGSSAGNFFSERSVGHLGFTGTSFWMDWERGIIVVLLTNRVHPSRFNDRLRRFRPLLHDAVMRVWGNGS